jgi:hypothetical protein
MRSRTEMYRRHRGDARRRNWHSSWAALLGCLLPAVLLQGCLSDDPFTEGNHWAEIEFDGYTVGEDRDNSGQSISCERESDGGRLSRLVDHERWPKDSAEWLVGNTEIAMRLDLPSPGGEASIEFIIGDAVYRSDTGTHTKVQPRPGDKGVYRDSTGAKWRVEGPVGGRAVFRDIPLTSGDPFEGKEHLDRLVVEWDCLGRPSRPANAYSRQSTPRTKLPDPVP